MKRYVSSRLLQLIPVLFGVTILTFALLSLAPGDPAQKKLSAQGIAVTKDVLLETRKEMGLDRPWTLRYASWLSDLLHGDLGNSYKDGTPVAGKLIKAMKYTGILAISAFLLALVVSLPLGIYCGVKKDGFLDRIIQLLCLAGNAVPGFLLAVLLIYLFCIRLKVFPIIAKGTVQGLFLPTLTLALPLASRLTRQVRASVLNQMEMEYVDGAKARGVLKPYILIFHILRNAMISILTVFGLSIGTLLGGSVVIENIFMWPGMGKVVMDSITARDYPVVQGFVLVMAMIYVIINLLVDISYHLLDPRLEEI
ncbi:nickel ABC transporter permease [Lacrimispora sp.]|uniref:nickel ABC transporter permease n=1 Tax=Lacrimispora sp. TaxID=2719234 RepID=UPI0028B0CFA2|nr:nickel ABC transporter permease [Lacrimispora sp.]